MKISIHGLGNRLRRARNGTGLNQTEVAGKIGVSWMTVHRWERSQRSISEENLNQLCELYDKPLRWFLTLEDGDLEGFELGPPGESSRMSPSPAVNRLIQKIADAPASHRSMIEKVVEDLLDSMRESTSNR